MSRAASAMPITATARPSTATVIEVRPVAASSSRCSPSRPTSMCSCSISREFPTTTTRPATVARAPYPGTFSKRSTGYIGARTAAARATTALARGCSDSRSTAAASARTSVSSIPSTMRSVTSGSPLVSVPVLSITTVSTRAAVSIPVACLNSTPRFAPRPLPIMIAVGVANPNASGQVITTTVIAKSTASLAGRSLKTSHETSVSAPPIRATNTNQNAARSARRCPGALEFCASWTSRTICARAVSAPTFVADTRSVPFVLIVAPMTAEPGSLCTGRLSPVTIDSSTSLSPSSTTPSAAIFVPGRTSNRSPTTTSSVGISTASPSRTTRAAAGARSSSARIASLAPPRARISNQWPNRTKAAKTVAAS